MFCREMTAPASTSFFSYCDCCSSRPIIMLASSCPVTPCASTVVTTSPARRMVMRSEMCSTSRILWLIKMMDFPSLTSFFMMANRPSTSMSVSAADGSSKISSSAPW